ncbi:MAG TPA: hypothetical protein VGD14_09530 [bacterium]
MDRFINSILPQVPGCPKPLVKNEVLRAAINFCQDSLIWQQDEDKIVDVGGSTITLAVTSGAACTGVQISLDENEIHTYKRSGLTVTLDDAVTESTTYQVTTFVKPSRSATSLPTFLYDDWFEAIESKTKAELMMMPGKEWANPALAGVNQTKYLHELGNAKSKALMVNDQTDLRVIQRSFV